MLMANCRNCKKKIDASADRCPHCNVKHPGANSSIRNGGLTALAIFFGVLLLSFLGGGANESRKVESMPSASSNLPRDSDIVPPVRRNAATESEIAQCADLARRKNVRLSGGLNTRNLGGGMNWYGGSAIYRGRHCSFVCLFWDGEMDSAACARPNGTAQEELFCANPPCFR